MPRLDLIRRLAEEALASHKMSAKDRGALSKYLRAQPEAHRDFEAGYHPTRGGVPMDPAEFRRRAGLSVPSPEQPWYHGGESRLKLYEPSFFTSEPSGAAWYGVEKAERPTSPRRSTLGAVGEYSIDAKNPARHRDMLQALVDEPSLAAQWEDLGYYHSGYGNINDLSYVPEARDLLKQRGFDSALALDILERSEIPTLIPMSLDQVQPRARRLVTYKGNEQVPAKVRSALDEYYDWVGGRLPFNRKAAGGLVP